MGHLVNLFRDKFSREQYEKDMETVRGEDNPKKLADIARHNDFPKVRLEAISRISDEAVLADVARNDSNRNVRCEAIGKITDEYVLTDISRNDSNRTVRKLANDRLKELGYE